MQDPQMNKMHVLMLMQLARLLPKADIDEVYNNAAHLLTEPPNDFSKNQKTELTNLDSAVSYFDESHQVKREGEFDLNRNSSTETSGSKDELNFHEEAVESKGVSIETEALIKHLSKFEDFTDEYTVKKEEKSILLERSKKIAKEKSYFKSLRNFPAKSRNAEGRSDSNQKDHKKRRTRNQTWKTEEDTNLLKFYDTYGPKWSYLGKLVGNKSGKQCRDRYMNTLRPGINYEEWTQEEENLIVTLTQKYGKKWCLIASNVPGRTENQVKNKYYYLKNNGTLKYRRRLPQCQENGTNSNIGLNVMEILSKFNQSHNFEGEKIAKQADLNNHSLCNIQGKVGPAQIFQPQNPTSSMLFPSNFQKGLQANIMLMQLMQTQFNLSK